MSKPIPLLKTRKVKFLFFSLIVVVLSAVPFFAYCSFIMGELDALMNQTLESRPSVLYSDYFVLRKGDIYANTFLPERLQDLQISFQQTDTSMQWQAKGFSYPESVLPSSLNLAVPAGQHIALTIQDGKIAEIKVGDTPRDAIALEPVQIAQIAGAGKSIRDYVKLPEIPTGLLHAIIAIEDQRFLEHPGFDIRGIMRALWLDVKARSLSQGGSTITQQLVKNLLGTRQKTFGRKIKEVVLAIAIEEKYSKDVILEKYLNEVYYGQIGSLEIHGVAEAARYFFNKSLTQLRLSEMALLAGIIRGPFVYSPYKYPQRALDRKSAVLKKMMELKLISSQEFKQANADKLTFSPPQLAHNRAPYFVDYVKAQVLDELREKVSADDLSTQGLRIFTTLDLPLQRRADAAVASGVKNLYTRFKIEAPFRLEGLLVSAEPKTGSVRAIVGGRSYGETTFNRALNMKRQVGSTFKPIVYLTALSQGKDEAGNPYTASTMLVDEPWTYNYEANQSWSPQNYEKEFRGKVSLRDSFANSINIPAAKVGVAVTLDPIIALAQKLGVNSPLPKVPSLALGVVELSPMEVLQVYSTFANRGERVELGAVTAVVDEAGKALFQRLAKTQWAIEPKFIDLLWTLFRSVTTEGTSKALPALGYSKPAYGKTGTTNFSRDAWFAGFSQGLVAVSWVGYDELQMPEPPATTKGKPVKKKVKIPVPLTGALGALPIWAQYFANSKPSPVLEAEPTPDSALITMQIDKSTGKKVSSSTPKELILNEFFISGTEPKE